MTLHSCATTITAAGTYDSCLFAGGVHINVSNVTISRSRITGQVTVPNEGVNTFNTVISDTTIACGCLANGSNGTPSAVWGYNITLLRDDIFGSGHGFAEEGNTVIADSWVHGLGGNNDAHKDALYIGEGSNMTIRHNSLECNDGSAGGCTSAIGILNDFGNITHLTITGNLLNTNGSYCFYGGARIPAKPSYAASYIVFTDNVFGRADNQLCGFYGPVTYFDVTTVGNVWARNAYVDGKPVAAVN